MYPIYATNFVTEYLFYFVLGALVGSFINVVALRYGTGRSSLSGRSICFSCGKKLSWFELVPLASFLLLGGKCGSCSSKISWRYFAVEMLTAVVFTVLAHVTSGPIWLIYFWVLFSLLIIIGLYDVAHKMLPGIPLWIFNALSLIVPIHTLIPLLAGESAGLVSPVATILSYLDVFSGVICAVPFLLLWGVSRGKWMGLGDGILAFGIGNMLGISFGINSIIYAFWIGAGYAILLLLGGYASREKKLRVGMKSEVPFAPFMILGAFLVLVLGKVVFDVPALVMIVLGM
jgi:prepilin signal peptidase PulO-like enzyme (type II secretory pathway)